MAKASSPVRIQQHIMRKAEAAGALMQRSAAEQIEYWANIGSQVSQIVDPEILLKIDSGLIRIKVEETADPEIDFDRLLETVEDDSRSGRATDGLLTKGISYQASESRPGMLEECHPDGTVKVGRFINGEFVPCSDDN